MLRNESEILANVKEIKVRLENGGALQKEKKNFYKIINEIKVNAIKSNEILDLVSDIRTIFVNDWRPNQHSIFSGVTLWILAVTVGGLIIHFRNFPFFPVNSIWFILLSSFFLFLGWFLINLGIHNLGHYVVGMLVGIKYKAWVTFNFFGQWALIIDYKSYLKASFNKRQAVHVSGPAFTLITPWIIYFATLHPLMFGISIYMFVASIPLMLKKGWDYGRISKERKLKKQFKKKKF